MAHLGETPELEALEDGDCLEVLLQINGSRDGPSVCRTEDDLIPTAVSFDNLFDIEPNPECWPPCAEFAVVKPDCSAWINCETLEETSFHWQDLTGTSLRTDPDDIF